MAKGAGVWNWRQLLREHRRLAAVLVALALCMKMFVPAGYMIGAGSKIITVRICADASGGEQTLQVAIPLDKDGGAQSGQGANVGKAEATCAWSALGQASLGGADPVLLALVLAFIMALGIGWRAPQPRRSRHHIRPPLRGPPVLA